jgi:hypothetical protein
MELKNIFTYGKYFDATSISGNIASDERIILENELERICKET